MRKTFGLGIMFALCAAFNYSCAGNRPSEPDFGEIKIHDVYTWIGLPATEFNIIFSKEEVNETFTYDYDNTLISIDEENHLVSGLKEGVALVTVKSEHFETTFKVFVETVDENNSAYDLRPEWEQKLNGYSYDWSINGRADKTTVFIGDSFFDKDFWYTFYEDYAQQDCLIYGIGSTTTYTWERLAKTFLNQLAPKNIVIHCGTNSVYDIDRDAKEVTSSLLRMLTLIHDTLPNTNIYYFTITHRTYAGASEKYDIVNEVNANAINFGMNKKWLKVINTTDKFDWLMMKDGIHPKVEHYDVFMNALEENGIEIEDL